MPRGIVPRMSDLQTIRDAHHWLRWLTDRTMKASRGLSADDLHRKFPIGIDTVFETLLHLLGAEMVWIGVLGSFGASMLWFGNNLGTPKVGTDTLCLLAIAVVANHAAGRGDSAHAIHMDKIAAVLVTAMQQVRDVIEQLVMDQAMGSAAAGSQP